jgi:hypothetical protein
MFKTKPLNGKRVRLLGIDLSLISTTASIAGMVLAAIGLGGIRTYWMAGLALIAVGLAQLFEGQTLGSRVAGLSEFAERPLGNTGVGMLTGRLPGGIAGIALGTLSISAVAPGVLLPLGLIILSLVLALGAWAIVRLYDFYTVKSCDKTDRRAVALMVVRFAEITQILIGSIGFALGILGLAGIGSLPVMLTMVGLLCVGFSSLMNSTLFSSRISQTLHCEGVLIV